MAPPDNATVVSVNEKPSIEALEPAQGYLKLNLNNALEKASLFQVVTGRRKVLSTTTRAVSLGLDVGEFSRPQFRVCWRGARCARP